MNSPRFPSQIVRDDESVLVASAQNGGPAAFEELVSRYHSRIFRLTQRITGNREDGEDGMQEAFLKAYVHLRGFRGNSRFYTWLPRIAVNEALLRLRQRRRRCSSRLSLDEPIEGDSGPVPREVEDWKPNPEEEFAHAEIGNIVDNLLDQLEPQYAIVLVLRDLKEPSTRETASALGLSVPARLVVPQCNWRKPASLKCSAQRAQPSRISSAGPASTIPLITRARILWRSFAVSPRKASSW